ncbi:zinc-binding protein A33 isoform X2 [Betta splendens]|uniref:Zinc-binding protein A33 isoform X2 n=1 Tax=Betta splendens TaxID=158456 RepID=A0A6P7LYY6_BETSP|nr:zinc-binding protein A33 isoform X2 [Betta splendens]
MFITAIKTRGSYRPVLNVPAWRPGSRREFVSAERFRDRMTGNKRSKGRGDAARNKSGAQGGAAAQCCPHAALHHSSTETGVRSEDAIMEMKSILKTGKKAKLLPRAEDGSTTQSSSIGAVRWNLPEESLQAHSSAPSRPSRPSRPSSLSKHSQHPRQNGLKNLRSLQECVQFIQHWKKQVDRVCKDGGDPDGGPGKPEAPRAPSHAGLSLEESRKLILEWADELHHVDKDAPWTPESVECDSKEEQDANEEAQVRIMEWAKELQAATESCGVQSNELGKVLHLLGMKSKRLVNLSHLLEFITWSLLKDDGTNTIPQLWLLAKQRTWEAGIPRYIPQSVWTWICSAAADVTLDPVTSHPWLNLSEDQRMVQEALSQSDLAPGPQRFDVWPCVLGWQGFGAGRHYWEVDIANNGYWRIGLAAAGSPRHGRFAMSPKEGYWVLWRSTRQFYACARPEAPLPLGLVPRRMGIYLDYEEGQISFYNAESKSHIYTFSGNFRAKLYPLFAPLDGRTLMRIVPPRPSPAE